MNKVKGFDYLSGKPLTLSLKDWKAKARDVQKNGGVVRTVWGLGETFFYLPNKAKRQELVAEAYEVGIAQ